MSAQADFCVSFGLHKNHGSMFVQGKFVLPLYDQVQTGTHEFLLIRR